MSLPMAIIPSVQKGEKFLVGMVSNGLPFVLQHIDGSTSATIWGNGEFSKEMIKEIEQQTIDQFGKYSDSDGHLEQKADPEPIPTKNWAAFSTILHIGDTVGLERVKSMNRDGTAVSIFITDERYREHKILISIADHDPSIMKCQVDLPESFLEEEITIDKLTEILELFASKIDAYQLFWNDLCELDQNVCILEPARPGFRDVERIIYLESQLNLSIMVNPTSPRIMPKMEVIGPEVKSKKYENAIEEAMIMWDEELSIFENMSKVFGQFKTPSLQSQNLLNQKYQPMETDEKEDRLECEICYGFDTVPELSCKHCRRYYHAECLKEYLRRQAVKAMRATFNVTVRQCPHCSRAISMKDTKK